MRPFDSPNSSIGLPSYRIRNGVPARSSGRILVTTDHCPRKTILAAIGRTGRRHPGIPRKLAFGDEPTMSRAGRWGVRRIESDAMRNCRSIVSSNEVIGVNRFVLEHLAGVNVMGDVFEAKPSAGFVRCRCLRQVWKVIRKPGSRRVRATEPERIAADNQSRAFGVEWSVRARYRHRNAR